MKPFTTFRNQSVHALDEVLDSAVSTTGALRSALPSGVRRGLRRTVQKARNLFTGGRWETDKARRRRVRRQERLGEMAQTPARAKQLERMIRAERDPVAREHLRQWDAREKASPAVHGTRNSIKAAPRGARKPK
jgi:hypothetical protein